MARTSVGERFSAFQSSFLRMLIVLSDLDWWIAKLPSLVKDMQPQLSLYENLHFCYKLFSDIPFRILQMSECYFSQRPGSEDPSLIEMAFYHREMIESFSASIEKAPPISGRWTRAQLPCLLSNKSSTMTDYVHHVTHQFVRILHN